ncbi:MAG: hypothetical protein ACE5DN_06855, partial [Flavobacteriales bacterium]
MKQFPFLLMAVLIALAGHSQQVQSGKKHLQGAQKIIYSQDGVTPSFISFAAGGKPSAGEAVAVAMAMLHPGGDNALHEISTQRDRLGFTHHRLAQYYKGIAVEDGFWFVHERDSRVESMNGRFIPGIRLNVSPMVSEQSAVERALSAAGHPALGGSPSAQLLITAANKDYRKAEMRLAWKVDISAVDPLAGQYIYVDAHSGEVICRLSKVCTVNNVSGQGATYYHGLRPITTDSIGPGQYELHETVSA